MCGSLQLKPRQIPEFAAVCKNCNKLHHFHKSLPALSFHGPCNKMATVAAVQKNNFEMRHTMLHQTKTLLSGSAFGAGKITILIQNNSLQENTKMS